MPATSTLLIAAVERSKVPFVAGGVLVIWALASAALGMRRSTFPGNRAGLAVYLTATVALVLTTLGLAVATAGTDPAPPWDAANGDLRNHRVATASEITSSNVRKLGVAWTMPLTASSIYGTFAANPVTDAHGVVYLQDLQSNVFAVDRDSGRRLWTRRYDSQDIGPNGVVVSDGVVYGATAAFAFALDARTGLRTVAEHRAGPGRPQEGRRRARERLRHRHPAAGRGTGGCTCRPVRDRAGPRHRLRARRQDRPDDLVVRHGDRPIATR